MKLSKKLQKTCIIGIFMIMLSSIIAFGMQSERNLEIFYDNIKILINGNEYVAKDANGNIIEPFTCNGTTYLPVRAIANAFNKDVDWEPQTSTITLNSKKSIGIEELGFNDYYSSTTMNRMFQVENNTPMSDGKKYSKGLSFYLRDSNRNTGSKKLDNGSVECKQEVSYLFNNEYEYFEGVITCIQQDADFFKEDGSALIKFVGDGNLLYTSPIISSGMQPIDFKIDVANIKAFTICIEYINPNMNSGDITPCIVNSLLSYK